MKIPVDIEKYKDDHPEDVKKAIHFAIILKRNKVISVGYNRLAFPHGGKFTTHAEDAALKKAGKRARGAIMLVFRIRRKDRSIATAKPCYTCAFLMARAGIIHVIDLYEEMNK